MGTGKGKTFSPALAMLLVVVVLMFALSGCGLGGASTTSSTSQPTTEPDIDVPASVDFGTVKIGTSKQVTVALRNPGSNSLTIESVGVSGSTYKITGLTTPITVAAGTTFNATAQFSPTVAGTSDGTVTVTTSKSNGNGKKIGLLGNGGTSKLDASPNPIAFGSLAVGKTKSQSVNVTNSGTVTLNITAASVNNTDFTYSGWTFPVALAAGTSKALTVNYAPTATGTDSANLSFTSDASSGTTTVALSGTATAPGLLQAAPASVTFPSTVVGASATQTVTVTNSGGTAVTFTGLSGANAPFSVSGVTAGAVINPGASVAFSFGFAPTATGSFTGTIGILNDGSTSPVNVTVSGTGTSPDLTVPASLAFGSVNVGSSATQNVTLSNTGSASLTITQITTTGAGFSLSGYTLPMTIAVGQSATVSAKFAPTTPGSVTGSITYTSNSATETTSLSGTGVAVAPAVSLTPTSIPFGNVNVGSSATNTLTIKNTGNADLNITQIAATGAGFSYSGVTVPMTLTAGQSVAASVRFAPTAAGAATGSIAITSNAPAASASLSGTGVQPVLSVTPTSVAFGNVGTGTTSTQALTLKNTGTATLTVSAITASGTGFSVTGFTLPLTIAAGASVAGSVSFAPTTGGSVTGSVSFTSNSASAVAPVSLTGTGVAPAPQLAISPTSISFGSITTGNSSSQNLTLQNTGNADLHITAVTATGAGFSVSGFILPLTLTPGTTAVGSVKFAPTTTGAVTGSVTVTSDSSSAAPPVALSGTGVAATPQISVTPTSIAFGNVTTGTNSSVPLTLKNTGTANLSVTAVSATGAGYSVNGFILPLTLAPNASAVGNVVFAPTAAGTVNGSVTVTSNSSTAAPNVSLSGTGVAPQTFLLSISPTSIPFGTVMVGASSSINVTLTNTGTGSVSVSAANVAGTGYSVGGTYPMTIAAGATGTIAITFAPQVSGAANGSVAFVSNATNSPATVSMTGSGQAPLPHSVDLSWAASTSTDVIGYSIYRSTTSGGPYTLMNTTPVSSTSFTDNTVQAGTTYFYVVRSVNSAGLESSNSNQATAVVPTP